MGLTYVRMRRIIRTRLFKEREIPSSPYLIPDVSYYILPSDRYSIPRILISPVKISLNFLG